MIRLGLLGQAVYDHKSNLTDRILIAGFLYQGPLNTLFNIHANSQHFLYNGRTFDLVNSDLMFQISPLSGALFGWQAKVGVEQVDITRLNRTFFPEIGLCPPIVRRAPRW